MYCIVYGQNNPLHNVRPDDYYTVEAWGHAHPVCSLECVSTYTARHRLFQVDSVRRVISGIPRPLSKVEKFFIE